MNLLTALCPSEDQDMMVVKIDSSDDDATLHGKLTPQRFDGKETPKWHAKHNGKEKLSILGAFSHRETPSYGVARIKQWGSSCSSSLGVHSENLCYVYTCTH